MEGYEDFQEPDVCKICNQVGGLERDQLLHTDDIHAHFFCLLFSSGLGQKGKEDEGIKGFLAYDIRKELKRGARLKCVHCRKKGATVGCAEPKCKKSYHLPCGSRQDSLQQYFDQFKSFCREHRPSQKVVRTGGKRGDKKDNICTICQQKILRKASMKCLWGPCCDEFFHRDCIQELACSAGAFHFRCPACNDEERFCMAMKMMGVYIPEKDASWENVENFSDIDEGNAKICHAKICFCPSEEGRAYHKVDGLWDVLLCKVCGAKGIHAKCGGLEEFPEAVWECYGCKKITKQEKPALIPHTSKLWNTKEATARGSGEGNQNRLFEALLAALPHIQSMEDSLSDKKDDTEKQYKLTITPVPSKVKDRSFNQPAYKPQDIPSPFNTATSRPHPTSHHVQTQPPTSGFLQMPLPCSSTDVPHIFPTVPAPYPSSSSGRLSNVLNTTHTRPFNALTSSPSLSIQPGSSSSNIFITNGSHKPESSISKQSQLSSLPNVTFSGPRFNGPPTITSNGVTKLGNYHGEINKDASGSKEKKKIVTKRINVSKSKANNIKELYDYTLEDIIRSRLAEGNEEERSDGRVSGPAPPSTSVTISGFGKVNCGSALYKTNPSQPVFRLVSGAGTAENGGSVPQRKMTEYFLNRKH